MRLAGVFSSSRCARSLERPPETGEALERGRAVGMQRGELSVSTLKGRTGENGSDCETSKRKMGAARRKASGCSRSS